MLDSLRELARHERVVAIGESGLDYFRNLSPPPVQRKAFVQFIELAQELGLEPELMGTNPDQKKLFVVNKGRLTPMPDGVMLIIWAGRTSRRYVRVAKMTDALVRAP